MRFNLMFRKGSNVPVFFYNFRAYDSHLMVWWLRSFPVLLIYFIGQGMEMYLTLGWGEQLVFRHSLQFLASSRQTLESNLVSPGKDLFKQLRASFQVKGAAHHDWDILLGKGSFRNEHLFAWE